MNIPHVNDEPPYISDAAHPPATTPASPPTTHYHQPPTHPVDGNQQPIGRRVALWRTRRGLSQQVLADLIGRSKSWMDKVERGERTLDKLSIIYDIADVLRIDPLVLLGNPDRDPTAATHSRNTPATGLDLAAARRDVNLLMYRHLPAGPNHTVRQHIKLLRGLLTLVYAAMAAERVPLQTRCRVIATVLSRHRATR